MALSSFFDNVKVFSTALGAGALTLGAAVPGSNSPGSNIPPISNGTTISYTILDGPAPALGVVTEFEVGQSPLTVSNGIYTLSSRASISQSSNDGNPIFCSGRQIIALTLTAEDIAAFTSGITGASSVIATGSTTSRTLSDRFGVVLNGFDFGVKGNGSDDDTTAIQGAVTEVKNNGGSVLYLPQAEVGYLLSTPIRVPSGMTITGDGLASLMIASANWVDPGIYGANPWMFFVNENYGAGTDHDIYIDALNFTWANLPNVSSHSVRLFGANNVAVTNCFGTGGGDLAAFIKIAVGRMQFNKSYDVTNTPYDVWGGSTDIQILDNYAESAFATALINFNAAPTLGSDPGATSARAIISRNILINTGSKVGGINCDTLRTDCVVNDVIVSHNQISKGSIFARGNVNRVLIQGNSLTDMAAGASAIFSFGDASNTPTNITVLDNTIDGASTTSPSPGVIDVRANGYDIDNNTITGNAYTAAAFFTSTFAGRFGGGNQAPGAATLINGTAWNTFPNTAAFKNNASLEWRDTAGGIVREILDSSNFFTLFSTDGTGAQIPIMQFTARVTGGSLRLYPTTEFGVSSANYLRVVGSSGTSPVLILPSPNSAAANLTLKIVGKGTGGVNFGNITGSAAPGPTDIPIGTAAVWQNSTDGSVRLYANNNTLKILNIIVLQSPTVGADGSLSITIPAGCLVLGGKIAETAGFSVTVSLGSSSGGSDIIGPTAVTASSTTPLPAADILDPLFTADQPVFIHSNSWGGAEVVVTLFCTPPS